MTYREWREELEPYEIEFATYTTARAAIIATLPGLAFETALFSIWRKPDGTEVWFCNGAVAVF